MKKLLISLCVLGAALAGFAEMDSIVFDPGTMIPGQVSTNAYTIRGQLESIRLVTGKPADTTTVVVAYGGRTIFTATKATGTNWYHPVIQRHDTSGSALTYVGNDGPKGTNVLYGPIPLAGLVTCTFTSESTLTTNSLVEAELIFSK